MLLKRVQGLHQAHHVHAQMEIGHVHHHQVDHLQERVVVVVIIVAREHGYVLIVRKK